MILYHDGTEAVRWPDLDFGQEKKSEKEDLEPQKKRVPRLWNYKIINT